MKRAWWVLPAWMAVWLLTVPVLAGTLAAAAPGSGPAAAATGATLAASLLAAVGWGMRAEGAPAPPWRWSLTAGAALLGIGAAGLTAAAVRPAALSLLPALVGALALWRYHRWTRRGLAAGFAYRLTAAARVCAIAAAGLWISALVAGGPMLAGLTARALGGAAYLGVGPLGAGAILWEYLWPSLHGRRRR